MVPFGHRGGLSPCDWVRLCPFVESAVVGRRRQWTARCRIVGELVYQSLNVLLLRVFVLVKAPCFGTGEGARAPDSRDRHVFVEEHAPR